MTSKEDEAIFHEILNLGIVSMLILIEMNKCNAAYSDDLILYSIYASTNI